MSILTAAESEDLDSIKYLLSQGSSVNVKDEDGNTALMKSVHSRNKACVQFLLDNSSDVEAVDFKGNNALATAASIGHEDILLLLLQHGARTNIVDKNGDTALMIAIQNGHESCARLLLHSMEESAIHVTNTSESNALMLAAKGGHVNILQDLLLHDIDCNLYDQEGNTALLYAVTNNRSNCLLPLINAGANVNARDEDSETALTIAAIYGHVECVNILLDQGMDVNETNSLSMSPLMYAAFANKVECVKLLIRAGAHVNAINEHGETALRMCSFGKNLNVVEALYEADANAEIADSRGQTPLIYVAGEGYTDLLRLHLSKENRDKKTDNNHFKALYKSVEYVRPECLSILLEDGVFSWNWFANFKSHNTSCDMLLKNVVNSSIPLETFPGDLGVNTPLQIAFLDNNISMVKYLLANMYLTEHDIKFLPRDREFFDTVETHCSPAMQQFFSNFRQTLWPLSTLCFLTISSSIGHHQNRKTNIDSLPLPTFMIQKLKFEHYISKLCVNDWKHIGNSNQSDLNTVEPINLLYICKPIWPPSEMLVTCKSEYCCAGDGLKIQFPSNDG